ncbi:MAG TPA: cytochrome c biogenesis protein CcsA [Anaerolineales bacterium]|nr:cytochrome c biogenesis protein CcsA [Anaerolineales bacterium]
MPPKPTALKILDWVSLALLAIASYMVFFFAPMEAVMGNVQRVFYFHVAAGWVGFLSFFVAVIVGIIYLRTNDLKWDVIGLAAVELGLMFSFINIVTGSIWARPIWNTWWTWDPRLVTATIMELIYFAYLMLRQGIENPVRRARFGAVYATLGFTSVPISFLSIRIWRTIHPVVIGSGSSEAQGSFDMTSPMLATFLFSLFVFTVIFVDLLWNRIRLGQYGEKIEQLRLKLMA